MKTSWLNGLDKQKQQDLRASIAGSYLVRERLVELLHDKISGNSKLSRSKLTYENPNWAYLQADSVGYERAMYEIIDLIESLEKEK